MKASTVRSHPAQSLPTSRPQHTSVTLHSVPQEDQDWGFVAMVLDRLFLWIFSLASFLGTILILCEAPALYDETQPIDVEISRVYRSQYLPELDVKSTLWTISVAILSTNNDQVS